MKISFHNHTKEFSICSKIKSSDLIKLKREIGFKAVAITDHIYPGCHLDQDEYDNMIRNLRQKNPDMKILRGFEIEFFTKNKSNIEFIVLSEEVYVEDLYTVIKTDNISTKIKNFLKLKKRAGLQVIFAHPFRDGGKWLTILNNHLQYLKETVDAIEINHTCSNLQNYNAMALARCWQKPIVVGDDTHTSPFPKPCFEGEIDYDQIRLNSISIEVPRLSELIGTVVLNNFCPHCEKRDFLFL